MRKVRSLLSAACALAAAITLSSCATTSTPGSTEPQLRGQWVLESAKDSDGTINLLNQDITLTVADDADTSGRASCADYHATVFGTSPRLWVSVTLPKSVDCETTQQAALESRYLAALGAVRQATVTGGVLDLVAPGIDLHYSRALFVPMTLIVDRTWQLDTVAALDFLPRANSPQIFYPPGTTIRFNKDGTLVAETPCAGFHAHYEENAGQIVADHVVVAVKQTCGDFDEAPEQFLTRSVYAGFSFESAKGALTLISNRAGFQLGLVEVKQGTD